MKPIKKCKRFYKELRKKHVQIIDPNNTYISEEAKIEPHAIIYPGVYIIGNTKIGSFSVIGINSIIKRSTIGRATEIKENCVIEGATIENLCEIGPFARLRPGTIMRNKAKIGNFVEVKKSIIGENTKAMHLSYIGDAEIDKNVNIGAGTITCNYDGKKKHKTIIEDNVFIGSGVELVAPIKINKNAYVGAGSTITENVPPDALAIARAPQVNKEQWVAIQKKIREKEQTKLKKLHKQIREKLDKKGENNGQK